MFADSSALVKLYADEPGHEAVRVLDRIVVSCLARVEVPVAIARKRRRREIGVEAAEVLVAAFEADFLGTTDEPARFVVIGIVPALLDERGERGDAPRAAGLRRRAAGERHGRARDRPGLSGVRLRRSGTPRRGGRRAVSSGRLTEDRRDEQPRRPGGPRTRLATPDVPVTGDECWTNLCW